MQKQVVLSADSTCDIGPELQKRFDVQFFDYHIQLGDESYTDNVDITPEELYRAWRERKLLPKTSAVSMGEYLSRFEAWTAAGNEVVHITLGSAITASYHNAQLAAEEVPGVYVVDSASLSTGSGHLVVKAGEMIAKGMDAAAVYKKLLELRPLVHAGFVLDTLEFMKAGGRCSAVQAFGANLLNLKIGIKVDSLDSGRMGVGKKFKGPMERALPVYVREELAGKVDLDRDRIFITHSGAPQEHIELVKREIRNYADFKEIYDTRASCTISSHCGPGTLGILYMTNL